MILSLGRQGVIYVPMLFIMNKLIGLEGIIWSAGNGGYMLCNNEYNYVYIHQ